jgi:hypothetical protein
MSRRGSFPSRPGTPHGHAQEGEDTIAAATKLLKSTILHDARNLEGKDELNDPTSLAWNVSSEAEAKVRYAF